MPVFSFAQKLKLLYVEYRRKLKLQWVTLELSMLAGVYPL